MRRRSNLRQAVVMAVRQSNLTVKEKLTIRLALALRPEASEAVEDFLLAKVNEAGVPLQSTEAGIDPDKLERILQIIVEYLPQILEIILALF